MGEERLLVPHAVKVLQRYNPEAVTNLHARYPGLETARALLGGEDDAFSMGQAEFALEALKETADKINKVLPKAVKRMKRGNKWKFSGEMVSFLGSTGVVGFLWIPMPLELTTKVTAAAVTGLLSALSAFVATASDRMLGLLYGTGTVSDVARDLAEFNAKIPGLRRLLELHLHHGKSSDELRKLAIQADDLCYQVEVRIGKLIDSLS